MTKLEFSRAAATWIARTVLPLALWSPSLWKAFGVRDSVDCWDYPILEYDIENIGLGNFMKFLPQPLLNCLLMQNSAVGQDKKASCRLTNAALFRWQSSSCHQMEAISWVVIILSLVLSHELSTGISSNYTWASYPFRDADSSFWGCSCGSVMRQDPTKSSTSMVWQCPFAVPAYLRASRVVVQYPSSGWTFTMLSRMFTWSMPGRWLIHGRVQGF